MWKKDERGTPLSHLPDPVARRDRLPALRERSAVIMHVAMKAWELREAARAALRAGDRRPRRSPWLVRRAGCMRPAKVNAY